ARNCAASSAIDSPARHSYAPADSSCPGHSPDTLRDRPPPECRTPESRRRPSIAGPQSEFRIASATLPCPSTPPWCTRSAAPVGWPGSPVRPRSGIRCRCQHPPHRDARPPSGGLQTGFSALFPSLLPIHLVPAALVGASCSLLLLLGGPHGILAALNSTWLGLGGGTYTISPSGSGISFFKDHTATICAIATTGAMLCCRAETLQGTSGLNCRAMLWSDFNAK